MKARAEWFDARFRAGESPTETTAAEFAAAFGCGMPTARREMWRAFNKVEREREPFALAIGKAAA